RGEAVQSSRLEAFSDAVIGLAITAAVAGPWTVPARAGGGMCHAELSEGSGTVVAMSKLCFRPGVIRADPGTSVTFVNRDPIDHNVSASGWGNLEPMAHGDSFTATFGGPGVYPFACMYHPGMVGAVVVGEDLEAGSADAVDVSAAVPGGTTGDGAEGEAASLSTSDRSGVWVVGGLIGASLLAAGAVGMRRRRLGHA
ncbi:MAG TPA: plastocyanin/azurin family copper-binding protein, partial [Actinomycetota bacterium]|nr:plastocyanin/azurin family copper-binding protein [Actinomycetota bacterium]